jgi:hypothetical protein
MQSQRPGTFRRRRRAVGPERRPADEAPLTRAEAPLEPAPPPTPRDWRDEVIGLSGLNVIAGIWLIVAPWVLGYSKDPYWNDIVFGAIVALIALARVSGAYRASWLSWINALIGIWLFISAWVVDKTGTAGGNDVILGVIVFILAVASASATPLWRRRTPAA